MCSRKVSHTCIYDENHVLLVLAYDYSSRFSRSVGPLSSVINDISLMWKVFRRHYCINPEQIFIIGDLCLDGKMIPWKERMCEELPKSNNKKIVFYYSGHGNEDGTFIVPDFMVDKSVTFLKDGTYNWYIIDSCYSHLWHPPVQPLFTKICGTTKEIPLGLSSRQISLFTQNLTSYLTEKNDTNLQEWADQNGYTVAPSEICEVFC